MKARTEKNRVKAKIRVKSEVCLYELPDPVKGRALDPLGSCGWLWWSWWWWWLLVVVVGWVLATASCVNPSN